VGKRVGEARLRLAESQEFIAGGTKRVDSAPGKKERDDV